MTIFIGVDPGMSGHIAVLHDRELIITMPFPCVPAAKGRTIDVAAVARLFSDLRSELPKREQYVAGVERVGPTQGAKAMFHFGGSYFSIQVSLCASKIPFELIRPTVWMKHFTLLRTAKDASRAVAGRLYPNADFSKKKDVDRAEAVLLARYMADKHGVKLLLKREV